jgi:hypothetical protein
VWDKPNALTCGDSSYTDSYTGEGSD